MGLRRYTAFRLAWRAETDLRERLVAHLQRLHFAFHDEAQTGQLMAHANTDVYQINQMLNLGPISLSSVFILVGVVVVMASEERGADGARARRAAAPQRARDALLAPHGAGGVRAAAQARRPVGRGRGDRRRHPRGEGLRRRAAADWRAFAPRPTRARPLDGGGTAPRRLPPGARPPARRCRW